MTAHTRALALLLTLGLATPARAAPPLVDYVVQDGDTCQTIARKLYGSSKHLGLLHANNKLGRLPHRLTPGMVLKVPASAPPEPATNPPKTNPTATDPPATNPTATDSPATPSPSARPDALLTFLHNQVDTYTLSLIHISEPTRPY